MDQQVGGARPRPAILPRQAVVRPTRHRAASQPWIGWTLVTVALLAAGAVTGVTLFVLLGLICGAVALRSGTRLLQTLRRLDEVGLSRWSANVVMMLLPPHGSRRSRRITRVPVPEGVDRTPEAVMRHVLADEERRPTVRPWVAGDAGPRTGGTGPIRLLWIVPAASALGWLGSLGLVTAIDASSTVRTAALVLAALPVIAAVAYVGRYRVALHHDGRLEVRRGVHLQVLRLDHLLQVSGWTWTLDARRATDGPPRLHGATLSLVFGDGSHAVLRPAHARDDDMIGHALRWWIRRTAAVVTPDAAYALGFSDDPRDAGEVRVVQDDRWMRRPLRRARTAAAHVLGVTAPLHAPAVAAAVLVALG